MTETIEKEWAELAVSLGIHAIRHEAVSRHAKTSDDPVVAMLRDVDERLDRDAPDIPGARVGIHAIRLAVSQRILSRAPSPPAGELREKVAAIIDANKCKPWTVDRANQMADEILALALPRGEGDAPGLTVEIVDGPPPLPGVPSYAIRKWDNHGLKAGTYRLYTRPTPATPEGLRIRAAAVLKVMLDAIEAGQIDSPELDGEPEVGIPPHRWHEEWAYSARSVLSALQPQAQGGE